MSTLMYRSSSISLLYILLSFLSFPPRLLEYFCVPVVLLVNKRASGKGFALTRRSSRLSSGSRRQLRRAAAMPFLHLRHCTQEVPNWSVFGATHYFHQVLLVAKSAKAPCPAISQKEKNTLFHYSCRVCIDIVNLPSVCRGRFYGV